MIHAFQHVLRRIATIFALTHITLFFLSQTRAADPPTKPPLAWQQLAPLPDKLGFGYPFAGVSSGALIVAGGANFPGAPPWEGGEKVWHDRVFLLDRPDGQWKIGGKLPRPLGDGVSITTPKGIACLGGSDAERHYADCFILKWTGDKLEFTPLLSLPAPCANFSGAMLGNTIYVAGGIETPDATTALKTFWSLDLSRPAAKWQTLDTWPGPERMLATIGVQGEAVYLFGGAALRPAKDGKPERIWLKDAYRYKPGAGWIRIADLPRPVVAAPTPALALGVSQLLVLGGDDGRQLNVAPTKHQGFPREILAYDIQKNEWSTLGKLPFSLVTTPTVIWNNAIIIPSGETRPAMRSNQIWLGK